MAIVDTSFLVALSQESDRFHASAKSVPLVGERFLIPCEVWSEFCEYLTRRTDPDRAEAILRRLLDGPFDVQHVTTPEELARLVAISGPIQAKARASGRRPLTVVDLVVCQLAQRFRGGVLTYDDGLREALASRQFLGARLH